MAKEDPKKIIKEVGTEATEILSNLNDISKILSTSAAKISKVTGESADNLKSNFNFAKALSKELQNINDSSLKSSKDRIGIEEKLLKTQKEITGLERQRDLLLRRATTARGKEKQDLLKIVELYNDGLSYIKDQVANTEKLKGIYIDIEKNLGLTGKILEGIEKIPILNKFIDTKKALAAANDEAAKFTGNRWNVLGAALKSLGSSLKKNLTDPLVLLSAAGGLVSSLVHLFKEFDERAVNIARNFGTTPTSARKTAEEMAHIAAHSGNILSTTGNITEAFNDLNSVAGTYANFTQETLEAYNDLVKGLGLSKEATIAQYKISVLQGKNLKDFSTQIAGQVTLQKSQNKLALSDKEIMESIAKTTAVQRLNIKGGAENLVKSVIEAKKLGAEFSQLESAASSLLQFEDSIGAELEAELLTGQNLNLERARAFALNNDIAGLAKEIANQGITAEKFGKMNRIQQEAVAKSLGFQRDEFGQMLENQEMLNAANKLGAKDANDLAKKYAEAADKEAFLKQVGDEKLQQQVKNISFQEKLNNLTEKLKEVFVTKLEPTFTKILDAFDKFIAGGGVESIAHTVSKIVEGFISIGKVVTGPIGKLAGLVGGFLALKSLVGGIPVKIVGSGSGIAGGGGGLMDSLFTSEKVGGQFKKGGGRYAAGATKITGLKGLGAGALGGLGMMAGEAIGGTGGNLLSSAGQGAMLGSIFGPMGALAGAGVGLAASGISSMMSSDKDRMARAQEASYVNNSSVQRAQRIYSNLGSTNADTLRYSSISGGVAEGNEKTNELLQQLVTSVSQNRDIVMSGNKVGTAVAMGNYRQA
jgi:hypothetical protein